ncbi:glutamate--cysteine ligase [Candidatus Woesearchaeota archaeon CG10_big_fil_rev_8_21_14_0_10_36_11]|nr:MAG: glutamate--cysteine ligase [Candidatus Woesearchaeota archaeon CG10_big_fil_rev_8_21_14_0_10_36_11]
MKYSLFSVAGIELEYMIVDKEKLDVKPIADFLLRDALGEFTSDFDNGKISWSNELVSHLIELKTSKPMKNFVQIAKSFEKNITQINKILSKYNCVLMPGSMHPWMNPLKETVLWKREYNKVYHKYNEIFSCKNHGWSNIQSTHLNLPFSNDHEFRQLHSAIRVILPLLPALCSSSPIVECTKGVYSDNRLKYYFANQKRISSIIGEIIPEVITSKKEYFEKIIFPIYKDIKPYDPQEILKGEWLNSRGAIARFQRNAIEIRLMDIQENPFMDIAICCFVFNTLKYLVKNVSLSTLEKFSSLELKKILVNCAKDGEKSFVSNKDYLSLFGIKEAKVTTKEILQKILTNITIPPELTELLKLILVQGTLSTRIMKDVNTVNKKNCYSTYTKLTNCLSNSSFFYPYIKCVLV